MQGPLGAYKSQKIKCFPAKSTGRVSWGPVILETGSRCSFLHKVGGAVPIEVPPCLSFPIWLQPAVPCNGVPGPTHLGGRIWRGNEALEVAAASLGGQRERGWGCIGAFWAIWDSKWGHRGPPGLYGGRRAFGCGGVYGATWTVQGTRGTLKVLGAIRVVHGTSWEGTGVVPKHLGVMGHPKDLWGTLRTCAPAPGRAVWQAGGRRKEG